MNWGCAIFSAAGLALTASRASAELITWEIFGHVSIVDGDLSVVGGSAALGDPFTIDFTFDPQLATVSFPVRPTEARWDGAIQGTTFRIGTWTRTIPAAFAQGEFNNEIVVGANDPLNGSEYAMSSVEWLNGIPHSNSIGVGWFVQADPGQDFVTSTDILTTPWNLSAFTYNNVPRMDVLLNAAGVQALVESIQVIPNPSSAVPEPASWALMIAGLGVTGAALRRRFRVQRLPSLLMASASGRSASQ